jgi:hypothetical protein
VAEAVEAGHKLGIVRAQSFPPQLVRLLQERLRFAVLALKLIQLGKVAQAGGGVDGARGGGAQIETP